MNLGSKMIDIGNPIPRSSELRYEEFVYSSRSLRFLPTVSKLDRRDAFFTVLRNRRSIRYFDELTEEDVVHLLWYSARTIKKAPPNSLRWEHRPAPSAGGRHPIDVLLLRRTQTSKYLFHYHATGHSLAHLDIDLGDLESLVVGIEAVVPIQGGTVFIFAAQPERTASKYENSDSLIWRDAGALATTFSLVAQALGLNACILGTTCEPQLSHCLKTEKVVGVGGIVIGRP